MTKRPRDPNQLAKLVVDIAAGEVEDTVSQAKREPSGRRKGGLKGGESRAQNLSSERRHEIAKVAARARRKKQD
jgi:hypothetical protein